MASHPSFSACRGNQLAHPLLCYKAVKGIMQAHLFFGGGDSLRSSGVQEFRSADDSAACMKFFLERRDAETQRLIIEKLPQNAQAFLSPSL